MSAVTDVADVADPSAVAGASPEPAAPTMNFLARQRLTLPRNVTTTYHLAAAYPFAVEAGLGVRGAFMGLNRLSGGGGFFFDLFEAHAAGLITAPNMCVTGAGGYGKSALAKTYVFRSSILRGAHARGRFVFILDAKGEWTGVARLLGLTVIDLHPGGPARVNPSTRTRPAVRSTPRSWPASNPRSSPRCCR